MSRHGCAHSLIPNVMCGVPQAAHGGDSFLCVRAALGAQNEAKRAFLRIYKFQGACGARGRDGHASRNQVTAAGSDGFFVPDTSCSHARVSRDLLVCIVFLTCSDFLSFDLVRSQSAKTSCSSGAEWHRSRRRAQEQSCVSSVAQAVNGRYCKKVEW